MCAPRWPRRRRARYGRARQRARHSAANIQRVFNLFVQGEQDIARAQGGLGLGLSLVQQLVALHGGEVSAFSRGEPGKGSEFVVQLPLSLRPDPAEEAPAGGARRPPVRAVLVVDDNRDAAETMAVLMEALGCRRARARTTARRRSKPSSARRPTWCCWTSACPA